MSTREALAAHWNQLGRAYYSTMSERLTRFYRDGEQDVDLELEDPRPHELGEQVLRHVIELNAAGEAAKARELFDPASAPIFPWIERSNRQNSFVTILGDDDLLVRRGNPWEADGVTFRLRGNTVSVIDDVTGMCRSRNREWLVLARSAGLEIRRADEGLDGVVVSTLPWPEPSQFRPEGLTEEQRAAWQPESEPLELEQLQVSDDGLRLVASFYRRGILLASRHPGEPSWQLLLPDARPPYRIDPEDEQPSAGDMTHVAISRDGTRLAWGEQSSPHWLAEIGQGGVPAWYATVGNLSEYPHHACFSDDGNTVALNSCHFYNGATVAFAWCGHRGVDLEPYEEHAEAPLLDGSLRVYAACATEQGFVLAGSGVLRFFDHERRLIAAQGFGSSASSIDYCPRSKRLALGSYSGFVHVYGV